MAAFRWNPAAYAGRDDAGPAAALLGKMEGGRNRSLQPSHREIDAPPFDSWVRLALGFNFHEEPPRPIDPLMGNSERTLQWQNSPKGRLE